jgi:hypothetical protein
MGEEIVADGQAGPQMAEEADMRRRYHPAKLLLGIGDALLLGHAGRYLNAVTVQGGDAAELEPAGADGRIGQEFLERRLVVAA